MEQNSTKRKHFQSKIYKVAKEASKYKDEIRTYFHRYINALSMHHWQTCATKMLKIFYAELK